MSSLSKQLAAIAASSSHQLDLKAQRVAHGKSLLFDSKIAVSQDFDTLYQICLEGWEDLCQLDTRFLVYGNSIFSEQSKDQERGQMTAAQNTELDLVIQSFLGLASSRLLLKPAQKAVEWLVRRFQAHEQNVEDLLLAFLPYYSTSIFISLLSIIPSSRIPPTFRFLMPYASSATNPPAHAVQYAAANTPAFFSALNQHMLRIARNKNHSSALLSFWSSVASQAVDSIFQAAQSGIASIRGERVETALLQILPVINDALAIKDVTELSIGACMLITILAVRGGLQEKVLQSLMEAVASTWSSTSADARIICLASLAQQSDSKKLPRSVVKKLLALDDLIDRLELISGSYQVDKLLLALSSRCIDRFFKTGGENDLKLIKEIISRDLISQQYVATIIKKILAESFTLIKTETEYTVEEKESIKHLLAEFLGWLANSPEAASLETIAQKKGFNLAQLGAFLQISSFETIEPEANNADEEQLVVETSQLQVDVSSLTLSEAVTNDKTPAYLEQTESSTFVELFQLFSQFATSKAGAELFLNHPILRKKDLKKGDPTFLGFLLRAICLSRSTRLRILALNALKDTITTFGKDKTDFQLLVPYLIHILTNPQSAVRKAGAQCILAINKAYEVTESPHHWAKDSFYSKAVSKLTVLPRADVKVLLGSVIAPVLEECMMDNTFVVKTLSVSLSKSSSSSKPDKSGQQLRSSTRTAILEFLASHSARTGILTVRSTLFSILTSVGKAGSSVRSSILIPVVQEWVSHSKEEVEVICKAQNIDLSITTSAHFDCITAREQNGVEYLGTLISNQIPRDDVIISAYSRLASIWVDISQETRFKVISTALQLALSVDESSISKTAKDQANAFLRSSTLLPEDLVHLLNDLPTTNMPDGPSPKKRRTSRTEVSNYEHTPQDTLAALRQYTLVLEIVDLSETTNHPELLTGLFKVLSELQGLASQTDSNLGYLKTLNINCLLHIAEQLKDNPQINIDSSSIRTDLVVDTIRGSTNSQLQSSSLLLISCLAVWVPDAVLHSVMPIFTFMGQTILRQGDDYSAHVIDQTISRVVPPLVASLKRRSRDVVAGVTEMLVSFTTAFEHIPLHRRLVLFEHIINALGPEDCLFAVIVLMIDRHPADQTTVSFIIDLLNRYDAKVGLNAINRSVEIASEIVHSRKGHAEILLNLKDIPIEELQTKAQNLIGAISNILANSSLRNRMAKSFLADDEQVEIQQASYGRLLVSSIRLTQESKSKPYSDTTKRLFSSVLRLLPTVDLVTSANTLLDKNQNADIREMVLISITSQCRALKQGDSSSIASLLEFISKAVHVLENATDDAHKLTAIACIDGIVSKFGRKDPAKVLSAAQVLVGPNGLGSSSSRVRTSSLYTLSTMIPILGEEMIPLAPKMLDQCCALLSGNVETDTPDMQLQSVCFNLLVATTEHLSFVLSKNRLDKAIQLTQLSLNQSISQRTDAQDQFYVVLAQKVSAPEIFSAIQRNYDVARRKQSFEALSHYYNLAKLAVEAQSKADCIKNAKLLFSFLQDAFETRTLVRTNQQDFQISYSMAEELEVHAIDVALSLVLKINEVTFEPFFSQLKDWAESNPASSTTRSITLFQFLRVLLHRLKALVTKYLGYVLKPIESILTRDFTDDSDETMLLRTVLSVLSQGFEYDEDEFWLSDPHFTAVADPLLLQLSHQADGLSTTHVIPAITGLASASSLDKHSEKINKGLLNLFGSDSASVRLAAVKCQRSLTDKLGEDWVSDLLLNQMLTKIVELFEDDDEKVEKETRTWIREVEEISGSLDDRFE